MILQKRSYRNIPPVKVIACALSTRQYLKLYFRFLRERHFDGLDLDWEYPACRGSPPEDKERFTTLLKVHKQNLIAVINPIIDYRAHSINLVAITVINDMT